MPNRNRAYDVVLYGATGFTGKLIARQLEKHGVSFAVAGRSADKVQALSASLKTNPEPIVASVDEPDSLVAMAKQGRVLISAAGPFAQVGMPVARAAVEAGTHYLDTTGEQGFVRQVVEELDGPAKDAGVALSPAMGFDVVPGDVAALKAAQSLAENGKVPWLKRVDIVYKIGGTKITRGTLRSLLGVLETEGFVWKGGKFAKLDRRVDSPSFQFPGSEKTRKALLSPLAESVTVPRSVKAENVYTYMLMNPQREGFVKVLQPLVGAMADGPVKQAVDKLIDLLPEGPDEADRKGSFFQILAQVQTADGREARVLASGTDSYGLTGELLAVYALVLAKPGYKKKGVLSPSRVADPDSTLALLHDHPLTFTTL